SHCSYHRRALKGQLHANHQSLSAHFLNSIPAIGGLTHSIHKITPLFGSLLSQLLILNSFNDRKGRSAGQRISAIGRSVFPVFKSISYVVSCNHSANRKASA